MKLIPLDSRYEWSPWNNLLTTRREARILQKALQDINNEQCVFMNLDSRMGRKFYQKNLQARFYFNTGKSNN